jgi:hypothetical protein
MKLPQTGGCQCGAVRYEITQAPYMVYTCHCPARESLDQRGRIIPSLLPAIADLGPVRDEGSSSDERDI